MDIAEMYSILKSSISESRYLHTLGVVGTAISLSEIHGCNKEKAHLAALLHDCAKRMDVNEMIETSMKEGFAPDEFEIAVPPILHAPAGAAKARSDYGITDYEILHAIRAHTIGCVHPSKLDAVIFIADFIEPGRKPFPGLEEVRKLSKTDLLSALKLCANLSGEYVVSQGGKMHPTTIKMINDTEDLI
ncbi:MAG: bis(5'-nucleosyl)-tetraphosphatase (symmetrical) YqeK [Clostridia bacterium]|nr:bis(5'-nucleosyl)-tetraphosphatase (symmetrical) YqeK [Clostridia bacterium]